MKYTDKLFFFACLPTRLLIAQNAKRIPRPLLLVPAIGFGYRYVMGDRLGTRGMFGSKIWWQEMRLIHSMMWFMAYDSPDDAKTILTLDVLIGLAAKLLVAT